MSSYKGEHQPLPDGRCEHRWANRLRRTVSGCPASAVALRNAELAEKVRGLQSDDVWIYGDHGDHVEEYVSRADVLRLLEPRRTPPSEPEP